MDRILLSTLIGLVTYMTLKSSPIEENIINEVKDVKDVKEVKTGGSKCILEPECFHICKRGKIIIEELKDKCDTNEYKEIIQMYIKIFCFEISLLKNEKNKINNILNLVKIKYSIVNEQNIRKFLSDIFENIHLLLIKIKASNNILLINEQVKKDHIKSIINLINKINL